jgi:glutamate-1-semialdehyde aminotransferase/spore coat polysaccharide biosynthesis protein SpsF (cytidylyltransferase family)
MEKNLKIIAIVQARFNSKRFPGKVLKKINGKTILEILLKRLQKSKKITKIVVATSNENSDLAIVNIASKLNFDVFLGSKNDVLSRFYFAAKKFKADAIIRITADCPLVDPNLVDELIKKFKQNKFDYISNSIEPSFPDGLDLEIFTFKALKKVFKECKSSIQREHVTPYFYKSNKFRIFNIKNNIDYSQARWTLDEQADYDVLKNIFQHFKSNIFFSWLEVIKLMNKKPKIFLKNNDIRRDEGMSMPTGQKIWKRAKNIIPGGNMLLSKRSELFAPDLWPAYYKKSKGCFVWDLDNKKYIDFSLMGVGTNILGYANPEVDSAVGKVVRNGNMTSLNAPEEVYLAEKLIEMHPWASMVRFARTGGEANAIALRIARAASGKNKVAICGYHGWHDWYLSSNLKNNKNLKEFLLPGLDPKGVPDVLAKTTLPFLYNRYDQLENLVKKNDDIGVIFMEVCRSDKPKNNFLKKVRDLASRKNIVLIFDECSSGFRENFGGLHLKYKVNPDIAMFGKALGNGYAVTSVIGKKEIMQEAQNTFISSTFWTERIGSVAALKCLEIMQKEKSWVYITNFGKKVCAHWKKLGERHKLKIKIGGIPALANFTILSKDFLKYKTFITQQMLKKGFLASNSLYASMAHNEKILKIYYEHMDKIFFIISNCEKGIESIDNYLEGPVCHDGFKRLN